MMKVFQNKVSKRISMFVILAFVLSNNQSLKAQNRLGMVNSNYAGIYSLQINPANICYQPISFDLNMVGADIFLNNNHFYSNPKNLFDMSNNKIAVAHRKYNENSTTENSLVIRNGIQGNGYIFGGVNILGPSILFAISTDKTFAITTGYRAHLSVNNISASSALALFEGPMYNKLQNKNLDMKDTKAAFASWYEIGGSYAQVTHKNMNYIHKVGGTLKLLLGTTGGYMLDKNFNGYNSNGFDLNMTNSSFSYAYAGATNSNAVLDLRGIGASLDFGYSVQKKERNHRRRNICPNLFGYADVSCEYKWKAGISLLDVGAINFYKNALSTDISGGNSDWKNWDASFKYKINEMDVLFQNNIKATEIITNKSFWMLMPGAISAQFDYKFFDGFYVNANIIQRVTTPKMQSLTRMNTLSIAPRIENENFEFCMPLILNEYKNLNIGFAVRYKFFTIGSDRVGEALGVSAVYGANIYTSIKYSISERCKKTRRLF